MRLIVLKLGGSLLSCADLAARFRALLKQYQSDRVLIVVGGGDSADVVRDWSRRFELTEEAAHWIAVRSLSVTRSLVKALIPECGEVSSSDQAQRIWSESNPPLLLDIESYLRETEVHDPSPPPHTWNVTSDSIAAWVAIRWEADDLVLLKSTRLPANFSSIEAQQRGLVDDHFPLIADQVAKISWCDLNQQGPRPECWLTRGIPYSG